MLTVMQFFVIFSDFSNLIILPLFLEILSFVTGQNLSDFGITSTQQSFSIVFGGLGLLSNLLSNQKLLLSFGKTLIYKFKAIIIRNFTEF